MYYSFTPFPISAYLVDISHLPFELPQGNYFYIAIQNVQTLQY